MLVPTRGRGSVEAGWEMDSSWCCHNLKPQCSVTQQEKSGAFLPKPSVVPWGSCLSSLPGQSCLQPGLSHQLRLRDLCISHIQHLNLSFPQPGWVLNSSPSSTACGLQRWAGAVIDSSGLLLIGLCSIVLIYFVPDYCALEPRFL